MKARMIDLDEVQSEEVVQKVVEKKPEGNYLEITDLPSRFKFYPEGIKLYGRPLKVSEIKKLTAMDEFNYNEIIKDVLSASIKGIDIDEIYNADKLYLIFWLRARTYKNANFVTNYVCEHCKRKTEYHINMDMFDIEYLDEDFEMKPLTLLNSGHVLEFDFLKIRDEQKILEFQKMIQKNLTKYDDDTITMAGMIKKIDGKNVGIGKACEFIASLEDEPEDYAQLNSHVLKLDFGIVPEIKAVCTHSDCKKVNHRPISFRPEFFIPEFKS